ncbi:hypothetical protein [uncultured Methylobacterium sp.]|uniref:hypothetical protein n=1 Tax=uncultured Methylobacterium sp. TaxID=157278 RepID=UPI0035C9C66D
MTVMFGTIYQAIRMIGLHLNVLHDVAGFGPNFTGLRALVAARVFPATRRRPGFTP